MGEVASAEESLHEEWSSLAARRPGSVLLRTARPDADNQCSFLFMDPLQIISTRELAEIPALFASLENALRDGYYVAGFLSYEAGYHFEPRAANSAAGRPISTELPLAWFGIYREPLIRQERGGGSTDPAHHEEAEQAQKPADLAIHTSSAAYRERIHTIRQLIEAGDFYQANFTVKMTLSCNDDPAQLFEKIMASQPVAYGALIHTGDAHILSASPELFFRRHADRITVRPMKGTAPRGRDLEEDARMTAWLAADEKNRAENVMIVDLMRNDLGRVCEFGTVAVTELFAVERYPDLLQMTSTVRGKLKNDTSYYEIFRSLFPCGSITGAPKVRTMQAIRELEGEPRGIACGAIGFISPDANAVFSVAIRTVTLGGGKAQLRVGSGITYDSDPENEYAECLLKARFLTCPAPRFELIETIAWDGDYALLDLHLRRLRRSAEYFDFRLDEERVRAQLHELAASFQQGTRHRVRLLLARSGAVAIASTPLEPGRNPALLLIASAPVAASSVFLRHKTTQRPIHNQALAQAQAAGCDDALMFNTEGQVTECAIHNVMIAKGGKLVTPPVECGLLPGVYRQHLLATHPEIREAAIDLDDVLSADRIFIFNSVRGLRPARICDPARLGPRSFHPH